MGARPRLRPRFQLASALTPEQVESRVRDALAVRKDIHGLVLEQRLELVPVPSAQRFWSPQLTIDLRPAEPGSVLHGRFGAHIHVWTLYVALHAVGAFCTLGAGIFGFSQYLAGEAPWALWALPTAPILAALVWSLAFVGQSLGAEQMFELRRFVEDALT